MNTLNLRVTQLFLKRSKYYESAHDLCLCLFLFPALTQPDYLDMISSIERLNEILNMK